ncbi:hypothetical protein BJ165DRAFT_1458316 [Panaeolus papilionaceus]|nr:hypothetical protein BJ165DRAFT_1458316 [Panaeolus papilionaceus]
MINAAYQESKLYIVDSPGFADPKISELSIISMVKGFLEQKEGTYFSHILFLTPITHIRLSGSRRHVLRTFQALTGLATAQNVVIVTTMWDSINNESALQRSESTFEQLKEDAWREFTQKGSRVLKFLNTQESALAILENALGWPMRQFFVLEDMVRGSQGLQESSFAPNLRNDLKDRIQALELERGNIKSNLELQFGEEEEKRKMEAFLVPKLKEIETDIAKFKQELEEFGPPPDTLSTPQDSTAFVMNEPHFKAETAAVPPELVSLLQALQPSDRVVTPPVKNSAPTKRTKFAQAVYSMKCWGKEVLEKHDT